MLFKVLALPLMASMACAGVIERRQDNNLVVETIEYCTTKLGTNTVGTIATTSTTKKSAIKTYTSTATYTPLATKTPLYVATSTYTTTITSTSTITQTSIPPTTTVAPGATQSPIGANLVEAKRDLGSLERLAAINREMIAARDVAASTTSSSSSSASSAAAAAAVTATAAQVIVIVNGGQNPPMLPQAVGCTLTITGSTTITNTKTAKKTSTITALPVPTGTKINFVTVSTTVSVTSTYVAPTPTYYAACNASSLWLVDEVAGMPVEAFGNVKGSSTVSTSDATSYDCCASCQQVPTCLFSFFDENSGTCEFVKSSTAASNIPWYVGNYTSTYDSLSLANGPAANMAYCGLVPGCSVKNGVEHCGA